MPLDARNFLRCALGTSFLNLFHNNPAALIGKTNRVDSLNLPTDATQLIDQQKCQTFIGLFPADCVLRLHDDVQDFEGPAFCPGINHCSNQLCLFAILDHGIQRLDILQTLELDSKPAMSLDDLWRAVFLHTRDYVASEAPLLRVEEEQGFQISGMLFA